MSRSMIDSGIEWIGKIPSHWKVMPLKFATKEINEKNNPIKMSNVLSLTNTLGVVPYEEKGNQGNVSKEDLTQYKIAYKDTVIINSMNLKIGSVGLSKYDGCVSPVYYVLKATNLTDIEYINYLFKSDFQKYLGKYGKGILEIREKISMYDVLHSYIPIPTLDEQRKIVNYLNVKCNKIDDIIKDNNKSIELLNEYKMDLINKKTYCPENSTKYKLKNICSKITDGAHVSPDTENGIFDFISVVDLDENGVIDFDNCLKTSEESYNQLVRNSCKPEKGDILFSKDGSVGKTSIVDYEKDFVVASSLVILRPKNTMVTQKYLNYYLNNHFIQETLQSYLTGAGLKRVSIEKNKNLIIYLPEIEEQKNITNYLDNICPKIDKTIEYRKKIIEKLEEYKKSLIYEVVTGKKEV